MAVSRLLIQKHFYRRGDIIKLARVQYCSSSSSGGRSESSPETVKENQIQDVIKTSVLRRPYTLMGFFTTLKEKFVGRPELPKEISNEISSSKVDLAAASEAEGLIPSSELSRDADAHCEKKNVEYSEASKQIMNERSDSKVDLAAASKAIVTQVDQPSTVTEGLIQSSKVTREADTHREKTKQIMNEKTDSKVDLAAAIEATMTLDDNERISATGDPEGIVQSSKVSTDGHREMKNMSTFTSSDDISKDLEDTRDSEVRKIRKSKSKTAVQSSKVLVNEFVQRQNSESCETGETGHLSESTMVSFGNKKNVMNNDSYLTRIFFSAESVKINDTSERGGSGKFQDIPVLFRETKDDQRGEDLTDESSDDSMIHSQSMDSLNGKTAEHAARSSVSIRDLFKTINVINHLNNSPSTTSQPSAITSVTDQVSNGRSTKMTQAHFDFPGTDVKKGKSPKTHAMVKVSEKPKETGKNPARGNQEKRDLNIVDDDELNVGKERSSGNKVLVRFLRKQKETSIFQSAFQKFGDIVKIEKITSVEGSCYMDAFVYFKDKKALQKVLAKTDFMMSEDVIVEAVPLDDDASCNISIPNLIDDPNVPLALVQNPTRTIKVKDLSPDTNLHDLEKALSSRGGGQVRCFFDSISSAGYVEFESEDDKERALVGRYIYVSGTRLSLLRIDTPRTTVVRLSNMGLGLETKILGLCNVYGGVKRVIVRGKGVADVHFKVTEWPNMSKILNSLNGSLVGNCQLHAQPAPVFPIKILKVLWSYPDGRRNVEAVIRRLIRNLDVDAGELTDAVHKCYPMDLE